MVYTQGVLCGDLEQKQMLTGVVDKVFSHLTQCTTFFPNYNCYAMKLTRSLPKCIFEGKDKLFFYSQYTMTPTPPLCASLTHSSMP